MSPSIDPEALPLGRVRRFWMNRVVKSLALVMVVVLAVSAAVGPEATKTLPVDKTSSESASVEKTALSPLPLSLQTRSPQPMHRRMTEAAMTSHNLTAAYLLGHHHRSAAKLSAEFPTTAKQG